MTATTPDGPESSNPTMPLAAAARVAARPLAALDTEARAALLEALAAALEDPHNRAQLAARNAEDLADAEAAQARGDLSQALVARLAIGPSKLAALSDGLRRLAHMPELLGRASLRRALDEGLELERVSCPLGVLGIVFEARPDAVPQITGLAFKSGNAVLLKGGREALRSNRALVAIIHAVLRTQGLDPACVTLLEDRAAFAHLLNCTRHVDLIVARGSGAFVQHVMDNTAIPVMGHAEGLCHLYLHADAAPDQAAAIAEDAKCSYPAACNAIETLLWHPDAELALSAVARRLLARGVGLRVDPATLALLSSLAPVEAGLIEAGLIEAGQIEAICDADDDEEYGDLTLSIRRVPSLDAALAHIAAHGSRHTEAIVCADADAGERFIAAVDAACVFVNASTRFADGYRFGLGAEVGVATGKLHARGPVGVEGLLTYRWLLRGTGQVSADYGPDKRPFLHRDLDLD